MFLDLFRSSEIRVSRWRSRGKWFGGKLCVRRPTSGHLTELSLSSYAKLGVMFATDELCRFLVEAKRATYAAGDESLQTKEADGSTTITYSAGEWKYHDNYFGGEPFGGREVAFFQGAPVYIMTYYGWVAASAADPKDVYGILQQALRQIPEDKPFRGPAELSEGQFRYENRFEGDVNNFSGEEIIFGGDQEVYRARYAGGLVAQR